MTPFVVFALPRSRTYWLSRFLSYGQYQCAHEQARYVRGLDDIRSWLAQDYAGTCETAAAPWWRYVQKYRPDAKIVVVRRPVDEVVDSLMHIPGVRFDQEKLVTLMRRYDRALDIISKRALTVAFSDLAQEATCQQVFEYCLPYKHSRQHWLSLANVNLQCEFLAMMRYVEAHRHQVSRAAMLATRGLRFERPQSTLLDKDGIVIREETFDVFYRDGKDLFAEHLVAVGEAPDNFPRKNIALMRRLDEAGFLSVVTARVNGRMMGYLMTILAPSLESETTTTATQTTFFATRDAKNMNLGLKLQHAAIEAARRRGADEVLMRAGVRGAGPKMGALYRRLGAEDHGQIFRLSLEAA
jgi:GNAT superfamily N-acetyltransferase